MANGNGKNQNQNQTTAETPNEVQAAALAALELKTQKIKQAITVTDLSTGDDSAKIDNNYVRYFAPEYDEKKYGPRDAFDKRVYELAASLISPISNQIDAFLYRATQDSYQAGKVAAYGTGSYLSPELKAQITAIVKNSSAKYADSSASEIFNSWKSAFSKSASVEGKELTAEQVAKRKAGADKILAMAQALSDSGADDI